MAPQDSSPDPTPQPGGPATPPHGDPLRPETDQPGTPTDPANPATG